MKKDLMKEGVWDTNDLQERATKPSEWGTIGTQTYKAFTSTFKSLKPGIYGITIDNNDDHPIFVRKDMQTDDVVRFKNDVAGDILKEINLFWNKGQTFKDFGVLHRRGYMLYGPAGTGKSIIVSQIINGVIASGGIVFICDNPKFFIRGLSKFRLVEPSRPVVCIFEDMDSIISHYGEDELLSVLDGSDQIDKVLNIATTNYPEKLDRRFISRPRRFDRVIKIGVPTSTMRLTYLRAKLPKTADVGAWLRATSGLTFASMTEVIISVYCLGNTLEGTISDLRELEKGAASSSEFGKKLGFEEGDDGETNSRGNRKKMPKLHPASEVLRKHIHRAPRKVLRFIK